MCKDEQNADPSPRANDRSAVAESPKGKDWHDAVIAFDKALIAAAVSRSGTGGEPGRCAPHRDAHISPERRHPREYKGHTAHRATSTPAERSAPTRSAGNLRQRQMKMLR
jgi:hypothetical protein